MTLESYSSLASALLQFGGLVFVALEVRAKRIQDELAALTHVQRETRELVTLGFHKPELFLVLADKPGVDPDVEQHYLQLWLNLYLEIHSKLEKAVVEGEQKDALIRDMSGMLAQQNMQRHWESNSSFYPAPFRKLVDQIIEKSKKAEPPLPTAAAQEN